MRILVIAGARPNFMKAAPLIWAAAEAGIEADLVHTGQHYDPGMSKVFFEELKLPKPFQYLGVGSGSHAEVTARCLEGLEKVFIENRPDWVLVVGDVNSTLAASLAAVKLHIKVAHVEAGLRSFDREMPEEINRLATDAISDLLLVSEPAGVTNLKNEGRPDEIIHLVGNVMIDTLERFLPKARKKATAKTMGLEDKNYALLTLHRPSNVDQVDDLKTLTLQLSKVQEELPILFPIHPRTRARLESSGIISSWEALPNMKMVEPLGYLDFLSLMSSARVVLTDSGGIQEETTVLGVPCLTLRDNTERPITVDQGTNQLVGARGDNLEEAFNIVISQNIFNSNRPELWDGRAAQRIIGVIDKF
jgi:UDP-N-acetylglucosamine 2-epimerase (non-hydrolysing)